MKTTINLFPTNYLGGRWEAIAKPRGPLSKSCFCTVIHCESKGAYPAPRFNPRQPNPWAYSISVQLGLNDSNNMWFPPPPRFGEVSQFFFLKVPFFSLCATSWKILFLSSFFFFFFYCSNKRSRNIHQVPGSLSDPRTCTLVLEPILGCAQGSLLAKGP